jgi:type 1 glutamine amidotransferase
MRKLGVAMMGALIAWQAGPAEAKSPTDDCPLARLPFSIRSPLAHIQDDPAATAVVEAQAPALAKLLRAFPRSFATIMTPQLALGMIPDGTSLASGLDQALAQVPLTAATIARRCAGYDHKPPVLPRRIARPAILVFDKITGFRDGPSVDAATAALKTIATRRGWSVQFSENGAIFNRRDLARFDAVVWNNVSGDALTLSQRAAFQDYIAGGGGYAGFHGSAGDPAYFWDWYADTLIGARFIGHPYSPQFQTARIRVEAQGGGITRGLPVEWSMSDEWYSFARSPRQTGAHVLATLDEKSYSPVSFGGSDIRMGDDHPIAWTRCVGNGRSFYSAIGHRPESYAEPNSVRLLEQGIAWAAGQGDRNCAAGRETRRKQARG